MANIRTSMLHDKVVTQAKIAPNVLTGLVVGNVGTAASGTLSTINVGIPVVMQFTIPDAASGNVDFLGVPYKFRVTGVVYTKTGGAGNPGNTIALHNGVIGNAITNAMNSATDTAVVQVGTLDDAFWTVLSGGTLRFVTVKAGGNNAAVITVYGMRVA